MKISVNWLKEYLSFNYKVNELCEHLTMLGLEVDSQKKLGNDYVIDIDLTPNRSDCLSIYGVARDLNASTYNYKFKKTQSCKPVKLNAVKSNYVEIEDLDACPNFNYLILDCCDKAPKTPKYIIEKLKSSDIDSIHYVVDILNYIMLEIGQPMHAYDLDKLSGKLRISTSVKKEIFQGLNNEEYKLEKGFLTIKDNEHIQCLAGILGSKNSMVTKKTQKVLIESAFFNPKSIINRARSLKLQTESSYRFERGVDFLLPNSALDKFVSYIKDTDIKILERKSLGKNSSLPKNKKLNMNLEAINSAIGTNLSKNEIYKIFLNLGCTIEKDKGIVTNPSHRYDLNILSDYIEEVARIYGYNNIDDQDEILPVGYKKIDYFYDNTIKIKNYLKNIGFHECINYSFCDESSFNQVNWKNDSIGKKVKIKNALNENHTTLRSTISNSLIENIKFNLKSNRNDSYKFFEISKIFDRNEELHLSVCLHGQHLTEQWGEKSRQFDEYDLLNIADGLGKLFFLKRTQINYYIGVFKDEDGKFSYLNINLSRLFSTTVSNNTKKYTKFSKFPEIRRDLSFIIKNDVKYSEIENSIKKINVQFLKKIILFDLYEGNNIPSGYKSIGLGIIFQSNDTLTHELIDIQIDKIIKTMEKVFGIELRR